MSVRGGIEPHRGKEPERPNWIEPTVRRDRVEGVAWPIAHARRNAEYRGYMAKDKTKPKNPYIQLLNDVCVGMGYCGCIKDGRASHVDDYIPDTGSVSADQFAEWVVLAENLTPITNPDLKAIK